MSDATEQYLDNILSFMALSDPKYEFAKMHRFPLSHFSPALVICDDEDVKTYEALDPNVNEADIPCDAELEDVSDCNVDLTVLKDGVAEGLQLQLMRHRLMLPKEKRGFYFAGFPAVETVYCHIRQEGTFNTGKVFYVRRGKLWTRATGDNNPMGKPYDGDHTNNIQAVFGLIFQQYFKWKVTLGYEGFPHISLTCTPEGAREVFRLRDLPEGKMRRTAIRHWVGEHVRRKKSDPNEFVKVLDYLRGETVFTWNGLRCSIQPSRSDLNHYYRLHPTKLEGRV